MQLLRVLFPTPSFTLPWFFFQDRRSDAKTQVSPEQEESHWPLRIFHLLKWGWETPTLRTATPFYPITFKKRYRKFSDETSLFFVLEKNQKSLADQYFFTLRTAVCCWITSVCCWRHNPRRQPLSETGESYFKERKHKMWQCFWTSDDEWTLRRKQAFHWPGRAELGVHV